MKNILIPILCLIIFCACSGQQESNRPTKKGSSGKTLEVLLIADETVYNGNTKKLIDSLFNRPQEGLNSPEPIFDVVNIPTSSFKNTAMFQVHRNVIMLDINSENPNKVYLHHDKWSAPQIVFDFAANSRENLDTLFQKYYPRMLQEIYRAEHRRIIKAFNGTAGYEVMEKIKKQFGFELTVSGEFELAKLSNPTPEMGWVRKETKDFGIGVLIHTQPYENENMFEKENILNQTDTIMKHVGGPADGSYMGTERRIDAVFSISDMQQSSYCIEARGLWRLFGDFMGGPYISYTMLTPNKKEVVTLIAYVYSPRFEKRDYLMQVESICHSINFNEK